MAQLMRNDRSVQNVKKLGITEFTFRVAVTKDEERVLKFIREFYYPEELLTLSIAPKEPTKADEEFSLSCIPTGLSIVAENSSGDFVGVLLCHEVDNSTLPERKIQTSQITDCKWRAILTFLHDLEEHSAICRRLDVPKGVQFSVLSVHSGHRGKSIGQKLMQKASENALEKGFGAIGAVCTSIFSARIAEKLGMTLVHTQAYRDWQGEVELRPPAPHENATANCYVKKLVK
ncbi:arylalkylamine N-acetyltransferase-like 2 [Phlebotomus argentipes]|uniref:arylalkylamine N-acetyltransferase-like 2 n=1 Tax=Phlebotomus argentipes TaxID=94469 RepID=UPI00289356A0|nr:arylalkylamine N-acetyltransferase-like 2 [Phlebotomus argentipes]